MLEKKSKKSVAEKVVEIVEEYISLKYMYRYACRYVNENDIPDKKRILTGFMTYFSKRRRKLDNKCRKIAEKSLFQIILEEYPELIEEEE